MRIALATLASVVTTALTGIVGVAPADANPPEHSSDATTTQTDPQADPQAEIQAQMQAMLDLIAEVQRQLEEMRAAQQAMYRAG